MQDRSSYSSSNQSQISKDLQDYINSMVEEIVTFNGRFDEQKKKLLRKVVKRESSENCESLEQNLLIFFEMLSDCPKNNSFDFKQKLYAQARLCYIKEIELDRFLVKFHQNKAAETINQQLKEPVVKLFKASSLLCNYGDNVTLNWEVENAQTVKIKELQGKNFALTDSVRINNFTKDKTLTLIAENIINGKPVNKTSVMDIRIDRNSIPFPEFTNITINGNSTDTWTVSEGQTVKVSWTVKNATSVLVNGINHGKKLSGTETFTINEAQTIQLVAINATGGANKRTEARKIKIHLRKVDPPKPPNPKKSSMPPKFEPDVPARKPNWVKRILLGIAGLLIALYITSMLSSPDEEDLKKFEAYKEAAFKNYWNAKNGDMEFYDVALKYCNDALSIKEDEELEELKKEIKTINMNE